MRYSAFVYGVKFVGNSVESVHSAIYAYECDQRRGQRVHSYVVRDVVESIRSDLIALQQFLDEVAIDDIALRTRDDLIVIMHQMRSAS